jgi:hypothetical protein
METKPIMKHKTPEIAVIVVRKRKLRIRQAKLYVAKNHQNMVSPGTKRLIGAGGIKASGRNTVPQNSLQIFS